MNETQEQNHELIKLSPPEYKVVELLSQGKTNQQIADELQVSRRTVETHVAHVFQKIGLYGHQRTKLAHDFLNNNQRYICMPPYSGNIKPLKLHYGNWQVISRKSSPHGSIVECKCLICNQIYTRYLHNLRRGTTTQCRKCSKSINKL